MWESVCGCVHTGFLLLVRWLVGWVLQPSCASFLTFSNPLRVQRHLPGDIGPETCDDLVGVAAPDSSEAPPV